MIDIMSGSDTEVVSSTNTKRGSKAGVVVAFLCLLALAAGGFYWMQRHSKPAAPVVDAKVSEQAVRDADTQWAAAAAAHNVVNVLSYYADDAVVLPANDEMLTKRLDMQKKWSTLLDKNNDVSWKPMYVEAAKGGDLVYAVGSYTVTTKAAKGKGKPSTDRGKYLSVWKKQADGTWKAEASTWNSDLPAAGAVRN